MVIPVQLKVVMKSLWNCILHFSILQLQSL
ncbi:hypothetical protein A6R68_21654 [Neotoma lepida]|uniref:Uncharacterized protein n=1 Tax=Neotoma lepida TaxID=56216 RepID=A0A1A6HPH0_NEOLE|nr:hypothetical protein A6R68_21654 [Neotoma lepida]